MIMIVADAAYMMDQREPESNQRSTHGNRSIS